MLRKQFKVKSYFQLKSSEKKRLYQDILSGFPNLSEEELQNSFPAKEAVQRAKIITCQDEVFSVLFCKGLPLIVFSDDGILPSVYFLWIHPNLIHSFTVSQFVLDKLNNGADLMAPGIIKTGPTPYGQVQAGDIVSINLIGNKASVGIGKALMSSLGLTKSPGHGKAVRIIHTVGDGLYKLATEKMEMPTYQIPIETDTSDQAISDISEDVKEILEITSTSTPDIHKSDDVLMNAFLHVIKSNKMTLPILTNLFYKNYLLCSIPNSLSFDIKKTKYKKLSTFLNEMEQEGIIKLEVSSNDVQSIIEIDNKHQLLIHYKYMFHVDEENRGKEERKNLPDLEVFEYFVVNANVSEFFNKLKHSKREYFEAQEVRKMITEYVNKENLKDPVDGGLVVLDSTLSKFIRSKTASVEWKFLMDSIINRMGNYYEVKRGGVVISSGKEKLPLIDIYVLIKCGHRKVTIVDYLEIYGIDIQEFSRTCQHALAASTKINKGPFSYKEGQQFQIQGSHVAYISRLLSEMYRIPKKYISEVHC